MSILTIVGNQDDVITELSWIFSLIGFCEGVCPAVATCRRSLDSQSVIDNAMRQNELQQATTTESLHASNKGSASMRLRTTATTTATSTTTTMMAMEQEKIATTQQQQQQQQQQKDSDNDTQGDDREESNTNNNSSNAEATAILLAAYREHVGPGLKVM